MSAVLITYAAVRMQFYAVEIARYGSLPGYSMAPRMLIQHRNRAGANDWIYEKASGNKVEKSA